MVGATFPGHRWTDLGRYRRGRFGIWSFAVVVVLFASLCAGQGSARADTSRWQEADPNAVTYDTPALSVFRGSRINVVRGTNNALWFNVDGGPFHDIGGRTFAAPALTVFNDTLWLWQTGEGGDLWYQYVSNPHDQPGHWRWTSAARFPAHNLGGSGASVNAHLRPAVAADALETFIVVVGTNERLYYSTRDRFGNLSTWREIPGGARTESGAAASTSPDGRLTVLHRGTDNRIYRQGYDIRGFSWDGYWQQLAHGQTDSSPAVTYNGHDGRMLEAWREPNGQIEISENPTSNADQSDVVPAPDNVPSPAGPGLTSLSNGVAITITGSNFTNVQGNLIMHNYHIYDYSGYAGPSR